MEPDREAMLNKILGSANAQFGLVDRWETELHDESRRRDMQAHAIARAGSLYLRSRHTARRGGT